MASSLLRVSDIILLSLLYAVLLLHPLHLVHCSDNDENNLLQGINSYRDSLKLPHLVKNDKAGCIADKIASQLEDQPCVFTGPISTAPGSRPQITNYPKILDKCKVDPNSTADGVILPVCVPKLVPTLVLTNYTHSTHSRYLNNSKYVGVGLGSEDDWMVMVLTPATPATPAGSFVGGAVSFLVVGSGNNLMVLLFVISLMSLIM